MWDLIEQLEKRKGLAREPASEREVARHLANNKLLARERIDALLDPGSFRELDLLVFPETNAESMEDKKRLTDGIVTGWGLVDGRRVFVFCQDATVIGGSLGEAGGRKVHKLMDLAADAGAPIVGINDGGGARIQEGVAALSAYGGVFARNVRYSGVVPQISVVMGVATGGAVYSPALTDFLFMVRETSAMAITGPDVVRAATGEVVTFEELGGATAHGTRSGVAQFVADDERSCLREVRRLLSFLPSSFDSQAPTRPTGTVGPDVRFVEALPEDATSPYDIRTIVRLIADDGEFLESSAGWATNVVCGFARIGGRPCGLVANQPAVLGGTLDISGCEKAARFVRTCDAFNVPLVTLVDTPGFRPGLDQEYGGLARHGAKLLYAYSEATVPTVQLVLRRGYGAGYVTMSSKSLGTDLCYAWPSAELATLGASAAIQGLYRSEIAAADDPEHAREELADRYASEVVNPYHAAARGYLDDVIDPRDTRRVIAEAIEMLSDKKRDVPPRKHGNLPL